VQGPETLASDRPCMLSRLVVRWRSAPRGLCKDRVGERWGVWRFMKISLIGLVKTRDMRRARAALIHFPTLLQTDRGVFYASKTDFLEYKGWQTAHQGLSQSPPPSNCHHPRCAWARSFCNFNCQFINCAQFRASRASRDFFAFDWPRLSFCQRPKAENSRLSRSSQYSRKKKNASGAASKNRVRFSELQQQQFPHGRRLSHWHSVGVEASQHSAWTKSL